MPGLNPLYPIRCTFQACITVLLSGLLLLTNTETKAQTLPVGYPILEDHYRRMQLLGKIDSNISFTVRPLTSDALKLQDIFNPDTIDSGAVRHSNIRTFARGKGKLHVLPISLQAQYNTKRPYGWNDGPMIPARGLQNVISAGVYAKYQSLSIQLRPEMVYAQNRDFPLLGPNVSDPYIDLPEHFGNKPYRKIFPGQSSVRLTVGPVSFGLSSENLWWGPGIHNSLLMSNSAPGFNHLTLNTIKPIRTTIGSLEAQLIGGRLEGSGFTQKPADWRYLSGMTFSYQPRWISGLFLGITRSLQLYSEDIKDFSDYVPFFKNFNNKSNIEEGNAPSDQLFSIYSRWLWRKANVEFYVEYSRGDHSANSRDYVLEPEHSRSYLFGFNKLISLHAQEQYIQINLEVTNMQQTINSLLRNAGSSYTHSPIFHGYTNHGQILGAGIGPGSNFNSASISWVNGLNLLGIEIGHNRHIDDFFPPKNSNDLREYKTSLSMGVSSVLKFKNMILNFKMLGIRSREMSNELSLIRSDSGFNVQLQTGLSYQF